MHTHLLVPLFLLIGFSTETLTRRKDFLKFANHINYALTDKKILNEFLQGERNQSCGKAILDVLLKKQTIPYLDALGKPGSGLFLGNVYLLGSYDECMNIDGAHYCTMLNVKVKIRTIMPVVLGVCMPKVCSVHSVTNILYAISKDIPPYLTIYTNSSYVNTYGADAFCYQKNKAYKTGTIVMLFVCSLLAFLCLVGTSVEIIQGFVHRHFYKQYSQQMDSGTINALRMRSDGVGKITMRNVQFDPTVHPLTNFVLCFSLIKNTRAIFNTVVPDGVITCVNGIRTISMAWIILGHLWSVCYSFIDNQPLLMSWRNRFSTQAILNSHLAVDTFFLLSGLFLGYLTLKGLEEHGNLPLVRFYLHRYFRLTPSYAFLIFFYTYLYPVLSDGPYWFTQDPQAGIAYESCRKYWWTNLLYVNNFYPTDEQKACFRWGWYLANDMQFYLISPAIVWCFYRFGWLGVSLVTFALVMPAYLLTNGILIDKYHANPLQIGDQDITPNFYSNNYAHYIYEKPYTRIAPYLAGMILGYLIHKRRMSDGELQLQPQPSFTIKKIIYYLIGWTIAAVLALCIVYVRYSAVHESWSDSDNIAYGLTFRLAWCLAISWVIYACHSGYGGVVNSYLSWKAFVPLGRLTYSAYLIHVMVLYMFFSSLRTPFHLTEVTFTYLYVGATLISFMAAFVVTVCIEYPVLNLENLLMDRLYAQRQT